MNRYMMGLIDLFLGATPRGLVRRSNAPAARHARSAIGSPRSWLTSAPAWCSCRRRPRRGGGRRRSSAAWRWRARSRRGGSRRSTLRCWGPSPAARAISPVRERGSTKAGRCLWTSGPASPGRWCSRRVRASPRPTRERRDLLARRRSAAASRGPFAQPFLVPRGRDRRVAGGGRRSTKRSVTPASSSAMRASSPRRGAGSSSRAPARWSTRGGASADAEGLRALREHAIAHGLMKALGAIERELERTSAVTLHAFHDAWKWWTGPCPCPTSSASAAASAATR